MDYRYVLYEKEEAVARITLNRPEKLNVSTFPAREGFWTTFTQPWGRRRKTTRSRWW
jgi:enoyl-CoA hydratase/carnithine racemase